MDYRSIVFDPFTKHDLVLGGKTLVGNHRSQTFLVVAHQVCTNLRRDLVPLPFSDPLQVIEVSRLTSILYMGLRSGDWLGHWKTLMCFFLSHCFVALAVFWVIVKLERIILISIIKIHDPFSMPWLASMPWPWCYTDPSVVPLMRYSCPVPLAEKHPQSIMFPPSCLTVGMVFFGSYAAFLLQTWRVVLIPKSWILISSDHNTFTQFTAESLANLIDIQTGLYMFFLEQGDLAGAAGFQSFTA